MTGRSRERQELADSPIVLETKISVLPCRGGEEVLRRLFEPLGYVVTATRHALDEKFPEWGDSPYFTVELRGELRLRDLLAHLYVLIPVMDNDKHYWVGPDEVDKLLRRLTGNRPLKRHGDVSHPEAFARAPQTSLSESGPAPALLDSRD